MTDRMKRIGTLLLSIFFMCCFFLGRTVQAFDSTSTYTEAQLRDILKKYSPEGDYIITQYEAKTGDKSLFSSYIDTGDLSDLNTIVHELCHSYTAYLSSGFDSQAIYTGGTSTIDVPYTDVYNSKLLVNVIPQELRTLRFSTYIDSDSAYMASDIDGIYGLLNEFTAYYHGTKTSYDLYDYYCTLPQTPDTWLDYFKNVYGTYFAYAEFKYYMLKYMEYAKANEPDIYNGIINNTAFIDSYNSIESQFATLINDFFNKETLILNNMKSKGYTVSKDDRFTMINMKGYGNFMTTYNLLMTEISKPQYNNLIPKNIIKEDFNKDGAINLSDLAALSKRYNHKKTDSSWEPSYDLNNDGTIDVFDLTLLSRKMK